MKTTLIALMVVLSGCRACEEREEVVIEAGEVEILDAGDDAPDAGLEPLPVVVDASVVEVLPLVDEHPVTAEKPRRRVKGWKSRCDAGFVTLDGGQVLACEMGK